MTKFKVYFEIFGKKMVTEVEAPNEDYARAAVKNKIKFHKLEPVKDTRPKTPFDYLFQSFF